MVLERNGQVMEVAHSANGAMQNAIKESKLVL
jgi:hypothetical protein